MAFLVGLAGCQSPPATSAPAAAAAAPAATAPAARAATEAEARAAVARYVQTLPNAALYLPDSASVVGGGGSWQVLVPRTDWAKRMPNRAAFEVDSATGAVTTRPVK